MKEGWFEGFSGARQHAGDTSLYVRTGGTHGAPPLVLLHGFPQTGAMWQRVAARLAARHWLVVHHVGAGGAAGDQRQRGQGQGQQSLEQLHHVTVLCVGAPELWIRPGR